MEPLAALGFAANIAQFVDVAVAVFKDARELASGASTVSLSHLELIANEAKAMCTILERQSRKLHPRVESPEEQALRSLAQKCTETATEIQKVLHSVVGGSRQRSTWRGVAAALRAHWNKDELSELSGRLSEYRSQLSLNILMIMNQHLAKQYKQASFLHDEVVELITVTSRNMKTAMDQRHHETLTAILTTRDGKSSSITIPDSETSTVDTNEEENLVKTSITYSQAGSSPELTPQNSTLTFSSNVADFPRIILDSLHFRGISDRRNAISQTYAGTFDWVWGQDVDNDNEHVQWDHLSKWLQDEDAQCYWISGKAGSGKSSLMKYIQDDPRLIKHLRKWANMSNLVVPSFYFWYAGTSLQKSQEGLLRNLLFAILSQHQGLIVSAFPDLCRHILVHNLQERVDISLVELRTALRQLSQCMTADLKVCFLVDGVDEYSGDHNELCSLLLDITRCSSIKAIVSSRPIPACVYRFEHCPKLRLQDLTKSDIQQYVREHLGLHRLMTRMEAAMPGISQRLVDEITTRADGVFLWVVLVVKSLDQGLQNYDTVDELLREIRKLPPDLEKLYDHMLGKVSETDRLLSSKYLQLVLRSVEMSPGFPMTLLQLSFAEREEDYAECISAHIRPLDDKENDWRCESTEGRLRSRCCGLIEVQTNFNDPEANRSGQHVGFLHKTVVEFLQTDVVWPKIIALTSGTKFDAEVALLSSSVRELKAMPLNPAGTQSSLRSVARMARLLSYEAHLAISNKYALQQTYYPEMRRVLGHHWHSVDLFPTPSEENDRIEEVCNQKSNTMSLCFMQKATLSLGMQVEDPHLYNALQQASLFSASELCSAAVRLFLVFIEEKDSKLRLKMARTIVSAPIPASWRLSFHGKLNELWDSRWRNGLYEVGAGWSSWQFILHYCFATLNQTEGQIFDFSDVVMVKTFLTVVLSIMKRGVAPRTSITIFTDGMETRDYREIACLAVMRPFLNKVWSCIPRKAVDDLDEIAALAAATEQILVDAQAAEWDVIHTFKSAPILGQDLRSPTQGKSGCVTGPSKAHLSKSDLPVWINYGSRPSAPVPKRKSASDLETLPSPWLEHLARKTSSTTPTMGVVTPMTTGERKLTTYSRKQWMTTPPSLRIRLLSAEEQLLVADMTTIKEKSQRIRSPALMAPSAVPEAPIPTCKGTTTGHVADDSAITEGPLTISDWRSLNSGSDSAERICCLVNLERQKNPTTRAWISLASRDEILRQFEELRKLEESGKHLPLRGVPFAAKDNIEAYGFPTTAACPTFDTTPATHDAPVIANLKAAGAILVGKTNLDQFATGLVGTRSPYGAVPNSFDPTYVSGGSSSGSAVVVARGIVPFSLGTDTAGSGRVPAGLNNIVGLKPTRGALSARGVVPACRTLDCVSIFALTVEDAETVLAVAEAFDSEDAYSRTRPDPSKKQTEAGLGSCLSPGSRPRLAICAQPSWFGRDDHYPAYDLALEKAKKLGWQLVPVDFTQLFALAQLLYEGPWVAERYAAIRHFIEQTPAEDMDPVVRGIIIKANNFSAADAFAGEYQRQDLARQIQIAFNDFDGLLVPTSPTFPTLEQISLNPVKENSLLGTYTNFVNFLDWAALAIPAGFRPDGLPFGVTLIANKWAEPELMKWARQWFDGERRRLGAMKAYTSDAAASSDKGQASIDSFSIAVVGAHLKGFPLNKDLVSRGAIYESTTTTSDRYKLYALGTTSGPRKPGLRRVLPNENGAQIQVEVWRLPLISLASFMQTIPSPLGIGSVELQDGRWVHGFICEPIGLDGATDITIHGGWRAYTEHGKANGGPTDAKEHTKTIKTILVANRGEIAERIIRTLRRMSLRTVAIYADNDIQAPHVKSADVALQLSGSTITETYLNGNEIIKLAKEASVDAIIPGYGFLSENADFASQVEEAGMIWIGPTPQQMSDLGLKHHARAIAVAAGVPTVPGSEKLLQSVEEARAEAERVGFPLMVKSTAGGGGIGLRQCHNSDNLDEAFHSVQRLAQANFGDNGVFLERFVENARHIEVQVLGDGNGRVVAVGERDCSLQRRHQKVVEESPAFAVPSEIRASMRDAAVRLALSVKYRNVGTVEFIYDKDSQAFYFLEVNTRLQVEHPITEAVSGLDLVECMVKIAQKDTHALFSRPSHEIEISGASIEVRIYAESPLQGFRPCAGRITDLKFPEHLRVDTWIEVGTNVTTAYDPMLAKLIATGHDRREALEQLVKGLKETVIEGVQSNLEYLRQITAWSLFESGDYTTKSLDTFRVLSSSFEVIEPGAATTIQDFPGRTGYWHVGIPPSGPMDDISFRLANKLVGNDRDAAALECTLQGPTLRFHHDVVVAVTGADVFPTIDNIVASHNQAFEIQAGQVLRVSALSNGYRAYVAVQGGIAVPKAMGSRATFEMGKLGGLSGNKLRQGDLIPLGVAHPGSVKSDSRLAPNIAVPRQAKAQWTIGVIPGPHGAPGYFTADGLATLFSEEWRVHHNSNRCGIRLTGPKPQWTRETGGAAGLHPSNIHDSPYSIGSVSFTGDEAVVLTCDGPSLGGFVVFCVVASAEMWKLGQARPGDSIRFMPMSVQAALALESQVTEAIDNLSSLPVLENYASQPSTALESSKATHISSGGRAIVAQQAGDRAILLEFGDDDDFSLRQSFHIQAFCEYHRKNPITGVESLTPGVRTLHVLYTGGLTPEEVLARLVQLAECCVFTNRLPSRSIHLPLAFDDSVSRAAIDRYAATIRTDAPWLPSNIKFLEQLNGVSGISSNLYDATFLVLGLGDVYLGSPCAVPLDPRHRLFGTKYNPSRSYTPRGSVGIGGQYMCIYATDSPGGYQLVGRTVDIWDAAATPAEGPGSQLGQPPGATNANPWLFQVFDRINFYAVTESDLNSRSLSELIRVTEGELDLEQYEAWLQQDTEDITVVAKQRAESIAKAPFLEELVRPYRPATQDADAAERLESSGEKVKAMMPGKCYKCAVKEGDIVEKDDVLLWIESSKMEVEIRSPVAGTCTAVVVKTGDLVDVDDVLAIVAPVVSQ
ncbi:Urea amidolyase [Paramyrothecium foliicola]|nr:Urea amidolyase [Paramyrothecium foliicola]